MSPRMQKTFLYNSSTKFVDRLANWAVNPWRRYSLFLILLLLGFFLGSSIGTINGVLALMDPIGALVAVLLLEVMIRIRRRLMQSGKNLLSLRLIDMGRIGFLYGLVMEGFKLL